MRKQVTYHIDGADKLRRFYSLAELQDFVAGIVTDNPGTAPEDVTLRMESLSAELVVQL